MIGTKWIIWYFQAWLALQQTWVQCLTKKWNMGKPFSTVATLGLLKILLILFNTLFWVSRFNMIEAAFGSMPPLPSITELHSMQFQVHKSLGSHHHHAIVNFGYSMYQKRGSIYWLNGCSYSFWNRPSIEATSQLYLKIDIQWIRI